MPRKRKSPADTLDQLIHLNTGNKKEIARTKKESESLFKGRTDSEVARLLGLANRQQATALKKRIKAGKTGGKELSDFLKDARIGSRRNDRIANQFGKELDKKLKKNQKTQKKIIDKAIKGKPTPEIAKQVKFKSARGKTVKANVDVYDGEKMLKEFAPQYRVASKPHTSFQAAVNWWAGIAGGAGYFAIVKKRSRKTGKELFFVVDTRTNKERNQSRKSGGRDRNKDYETRRAQEILNKWKDAK